MKKLLIIPLAFLFINFINCQNYFNKFYGKPGQLQYLGYADTKGIEITPKKYMVLYLITNTSTGIVYFNIATLNEFGDTVSVKSYPKTANSYWVNSVIRKDSFLYYGGDVFDRLAQKQYLLLMKVNLSGDTLWTKQYDLHYNTGFCTSMIETSDKGFIMTGATVPYDYATNTTGFAKAQAIKVDSNGNLMWSKYYGSANTTDVANSVVETPEKDLIFVGYKDIYYPNFEVDYQYYLFKTNSLGNLIWEKSYGNRDWLEVYDAIIKTKDNNYLLAGGVNYTPNSNEKSPMQLVKINTNGDTLWKKKYFKENIDQIADMVETADGNIVFTGWTYKFPRPLQAAGFIYKVNARGDSLWSRIIDSDTMYDDYINHINQTSDKGFILTGAGFPPGRRNAEAWIIKVDSLGCTYNGCAISTATHENTEGVRVMTLFPNPAADVLTIAFKASALITKTRLIITDILGRTLKDIELDNAINDYHLAVYDMPNGTYLCSLVSNGRVLETQKFLIIK